MNPLVSVIIPCFNGAQYVEHSIRSALEQTHPSIEVVVVDDGSTDDSAHVVTGVQDDRVRLVRQDHAGAARARNTGLRASTGEYVQFLDADNVITPHKVARSIDHFAASPGCDVAFAAIWVPDFDNFDHHVVVPADDAHVVVSGMMERATSRLLPGTGIPSLETAQPLFRRSVLERYGAWDEQVSVMDDTELMGRLHLSGAQFEPVKMVGVVYRDHAGEGRVTAQLSPFQEEAQVAVTRMIEVARRTDSLHGALADFAAKYLVWVAARECVRARRHAMARRYVEMAQEIKPHLPGPTAFRRLERVLGPFPALLVVHRAAELASAFPGRRLGQKRPNSAARHVGQQRP